ncbi:MAG: hemolysin [Ignavibacteriae bacterium HGW-Ignavibacteriae-2]|jgi:putative hemolysin|nr:MAG: hemolysin [Ignavibacteriae bacterium HGW-Ignavibacteriae-2]
MPKASPWDLQCRYVAIKLGKQNNMYEIVIIIILLFFNGLLAMSEIAFVSAKRFKLEEKAKKGNVSAKKALYLLSEPEKFLSAVQIGITLIGILAGAFGGYTMADDLVPYIEKIDYLKQYSVEISFALIVTIITYLSLVIGELVPKRIALNNPEKITLFSAPLMYFITKAFAPIVGLLSLSTKIILFFLRVKKNDEPPVTEDELKSLLELGAFHGAFEKEESEMIKKVFSFNDKKVNSILIPRKNIEWIDSSMTNQEIFQFISSHHYSRYFICEKNVDNLLGFVESKEFLIKYYIEPTFDIRTIIKEVLVIPESIYSFDLLEKFRSQKSTIALIVDEYGGTQGIITLHDIIEDIFGDLPEKFEESERRIFERKDGTYLVDGSTEINKVADFFSIEFKTKDYSTLSGFIMCQLGRIPREGDILNYGLFQFEVIDMDGNRIDKVLVKKITL